MNWYKKYEECWLLEMILKKREDFPVAVLMHCLYYCSMYKAAAKLADWHEFCPICKDLYREVYKLAERCH